jgi:hypothetical protein
MYGRDRESPDSPRLTLMAKPWRRRSGVISRPGILGARPGSGVFTRSPNMLDGGEDAPMDEQSNRFFKHLTIGALVVVAVIIGAALLAR